ncbi:hypothetical protein QA584_09180 [Anaerocolumna sp. AGMB13025]|uniref:hypothetical protein n=1 Tax=Anaerocolumna sp. AGMB13025 TaxID=3039116 RepID=UPI00241C9F61|nr:hypothetical protein [Anaerocolumna sp. AGMB13025]WFR59238.1 hypothetical protein QA584_09180 [Anaerocolumna sp. AGMB13025]
MSTKYFRLIWIKLGAENNRHFKFSIPVPMYILQELLDCIDDLVLTAGLFVRGNQRQTSSYSIDTIKVLVQMADKLFDSLKGEEPYDLVKVDTPQVKVSIEIR